MVIAALMIGAGIIMELCAVMAAPLGYQDETGFHIGVQGGTSEDSRQGVNPN
jgi:hypothetical protein